MPAAWHRQCRTSSVTRGGTRIPIRILVVKVPFTGVAFDVLPDIAQLRVVPNDAVVKASLPGEPLVPAFPHQPRRELEY